MPTIALVAHGQISIPDPPAGDASMVQELPQPLTFEAFLAWYPEGQGRYELTDGSIAEVLTDTTPKSVDFSLFPLTSYVTTPAQKSENLSQKPRFSPRPSTPGLISPAIGTGHSQG